MTKQDLLEKRWRVYLNYGGQAPLPDHLADLPGAMSADIDSVEGLDAPLPKPDTDALLARVYYISSSLPASPRQNVVVGWVDRAPYFTVSTEEA